MFGKIITRGRNSGLKRVSTGSLPPSLPFPCYFFPQTESLFTGYVRTVVTAIFDVMTEVDSSKTFARPKKTPALQATIFL